MKLFLSEKKPTNSTLPVQFNKPRLLIVGCGDIGMRLLQLVKKRFRVFAVTSQPARRDALRAAGAVPIVADLDCAASLDRLARLAPIIVHLAPPQSDGLLDHRTRRLIAILPERARLVYISTSGVYGDCAGRQIDETQPVAPVNARARRRVDAEQRLRGWCRSNSHARREVQGTQTSHRGGVSILRVPGIYAEDRLPIDRLQKSLPALIAQEDVYTNHIHADDLARIILFAMFGGRSNRIYHAVDDSAMKMADYFDAVANAYGLPPPPRLPRAQLAQVVSPMLLSFMSESRRLSNVRIKKELGIRLRYATVQSMLDQKDRDLADYLSGSKQLK